MPAHTRTSSSLSHTSVSYVEQVVKPQMNEIATS